MSFNHTTIIILTLFASGILCNETESSDFRGIKYSSRRWYSGELFSSSFFNCGTNSVSSMRLDLYLGRCFLCRFIKLFKSAIEYAQDLELYAIDGYGDEWNHKIACPLFIDMHTFLTSNSDAVIHISFTHLSVVIKFLAHLGLYHSAQLRADNFDDEDVQRRNWRASDFAGFNANFTFVLYENEDGSEKAILCMLNERAVRIPGCPTDTDLCPLEKFEEIFYESIHKCYYDRWCQNEEYEERHKVYIEEKRKKQFVNIFNDDCDD